MTINKLIRMVKSFPKADKDQVDIAARQLKMMHYDFELGPYQIEMMNADHQDVIRYLKNLDSMDFGKFQETRFIEPEYADGPKEEYLKKEKIRRGTYIVSKYHLLCMLRLDDEKAWDEVNELYFDD